MSLSASKSFLFILSSLLLGVCLSGVCSSVAWAEGEDEAPVELSPEMQAMLEKSMTIQWVDGPATGQIGTMAEIEIPEGYRFAPGESAQTLLELYGNPRNPNVLGAMVPMDEDSDWTLVFQFDSVGYVKDEDKDELDADSLISTFRSGIEPGNARRRAMGAEELKALSWAEEPFYDVQTNNLTWALKLDFDSGASINYDIRLLGRRGVMEVTLVSDVDTYSQTVPVVKDLLKAYKFTEGNSYAEWVPGDKVAQYGLAGLVAGGALAVAAKSGLLAKLGVFFAKFAKVIVVGVVIFFGAIGRLFGFGKAKE